MQHYSPELAALVEHHLTSGARVLDLGSSTTGTTQVLLARQCSCYVEDLPDYLDQLQPDDDPIAALDQHLLPKGKDMRFDLVLCWDLLSYMSTEVIAHLFSQLAPHFHSDTKLHLLQAKGRSPASRPTTFRWLQDFCFDCQQEGDVELPSWRHTTLMLQRSLQPFTLVELALQGQGMSEHWLEYVMAFDARAGDKRLHSVAAQSARSVRESAGQAIALPLLQQMLQSLPPQAAALDGGRKTGRQLQGLHQHIDTLYLEDVLASVAWQHHLNPDDDNSHFSQALLRYREGVQLDAVLLWDIPNYLSEQQRQQLPSLLQRIMKPGAHVHCLLINRTGLPKVPVAIDVIQADQCELSGEAVGELVAPPLSTISLLKQWSELTLRRHQLGTLANGLTYQEYWFVWM
ncbi:hypothetical protein CHH28_18120 [Bacterioplanes sanyensis]|uniref:Uncharacterized protein n=1 Tax=Bacterioplanes sanyensis TaxID=1249553 RepID=A0A222FPN2_9GAMM|nr:hypothetical protein [Bacterioplanes sanyensis]ASP40474.1 hypothetical protein CHH28_18120 [Bacterioplanes sanyensis]